MLILKEYSVSFDNKWLTIDIQTNPILAGAYISRLRVSTTGDFTEEDKSAKAFDLQIAETKNDYTGSNVVFNETTTAIRVRLDVSAIGEKPFYVFASAEDPNQEATTCAYRKFLHAVTFNKFPIYRVIACAAHEMEGCDPPQGFIDYLMRLKALEASIAIGDTESINKYHEWLILHGSTGYVCGKQGRKHATPGCGCHH